MSEKQFKPLYKSEYTSQGTLINEVFPEEVKQILLGIKLMETKFDDGINLTIAWFAANIPPYKKYFKDYKAIQELLQKCRQLKTQWQTENHQRGFPIELKKELYSLYEQWWEAYNDSGAGIRGQIFIPRDTRVSKAIQNL